jgi:hypothetical protein
MSKLQFAYKKFFSLQKIIPRTKKDFSFAIKACIKPPRKGNKRKNGEEEDEDDEASSSVMVVVVQKRI